MEYTAKHIEEDFNNLSLILSNQVPFNIEQFFNVTRGLRGVFDVEEYITNYYRNFPEHINPEIAKIIGKENQVNDILDFLDFLDGKTDEYGEKLKIEDTSFLDKEFPNFESQIHNYQNLNKREFYQCIKEKLLNISHSNKNILRFYIMLLKKIKTYNKIIFKMNSYLLGKKNILKYFIKHLLKNKVLERDEPLENSTLSPLTHKDRYQEIFIPINFFKIFLNIYENKSLFLKEYKEMIKSKLLSTVFFLDKEARQKIAFEELKTIELLKKKLKNDECFKEEEILLNDYKYHFYEDNRKEFNYFLLSNAYWEVESKFEKVRLHKNLQKYISDKLDVVKTKYQGRELDTLLEHSFMYLKIILNGHTIEKKLNLIQTSTMFFFMEYKTIDGIEKLFPEDFDMNLVRPYILDLESLSLIYRDQQNPNIYHLNTKYEPNSERKNIMLQSNMINTNADYEFEDSQDHEKIQKIIVYLLTNFKRLTAKKIHEKLVMVMPGYIWTKEKLESFLNRLIQKNLIKYDDDHYQPNK